MCRRIGECLGSQDREKASSGTQQFKSVTHLICFCFFNFTHVTTKIFQMGGGGGGGGHTMKCMGRVQCCIGYS